VPQTCYRQVTDYRTECRTEYRNEPVETTQCVKVCGGDWVASLSRSAFGMGFAGAMADDAVLLRIQVEAIRLEPGEDAGAGAAR
jgi:hypothetical protein